jgi:hypothetical protein
MRLGERGVEIESEVHWERGGTSVYFRDPDNNLLELATPKLTKQLHTNYGTFKFGQPRRKLAHPILLFNC